MPPFGNLPVPLQPDTFGDHQIPLLGDAVRALVAAKTASRRRPNYVAGLRQYLESFSKGREGIPINLITVQQLDEWFDVRNESASGRASNIGRLSALFAFAIRRGWRKDNPCSQLERVAIDHATPEILTPDQCRAILDASGPLLRPWVCLGLFAGLRPTEAERLDWSAVRLTGDHPCVVVDAAASKVRRRRIVPLCLIACAWLALDARQAGRIVSSHSTLRRARREVSEATGVPWSQDVLRHSHASYRLGRGDFPEQVSADMGNSVRILRQHYIELVTREQATAFWALTPQPEQLNRSGHENP